MSAVNRARQSSPDAVWLVLWLAAALVGAAIMPSLATSLAAGRPTLTNPATWVLDGAPWSSSHTLAVTLIGVVLVALLAGCITLMILGSRNRAGVDAAAPHMAHGRELRRLRPAEVAKTHKRLGLDPRDYPGVHLGTAVAGGTPVRATYEDSVTLIAGPRRMKSLTVVIPNILLAPGACVVTSVKPDVLNATAEHRATLGRVWVFDPQNLAVAHQEHRAWWNPLTGIHSIEDARELAKVIYAGSYGAGDGGKDVFFRENGLLVLTAYLFAAAIGSRPLPIVSEWLNDENNDEPARILEQTHPAVAAAIEAQQRTAADTRSGIYSHARGAVAFLSSAGMREWVTPREDRPAFDPVAFAAAPSDTLYVFSEESGAAGPLVAALTNAVTTAAEAAAKAEPGGRRPTPMLVILDEAGNICKLPDLPAKYSHWGGRGIVPITILQSAEQGENTWGTTGFRQLWNASSIAIWGGGNASPEFVRGLTNFIGTYEYTSSSRSYSAGQTTTTTSRHREPIFEEADMLSIDTRRMIVFASGVRAFLIRNVAYDKDKVLRRRLAATAKRREQELQRG